jgi:hypothetical protein
MMCFSIVPNAQLFFSGSDGHAGADEQAGREASEILHQIFRRIFRETAGANVMKLFAAQSYDFS